MTVGVFYAFLAYKGQFTGALTNIIEQVIQWPLTDVYSYRLVDIVLPPKEDGIDKAEVDLPVLRGDVEIADLSFRYAPYEPFVFKNLNLQINAGEFIAISGPSGIGKSSLVKVICGLYPATSGEVRIDGRSISAWGPRALRRNLGVVMQDDELLSGSIAENVAFFDEHLDLDRVWQALESAALADEVKAMPMKCETFVGDMGGALSGGQKQRLLIARALYRRPAILLMDEATSHLDARNEIAINRALNSLNITRIVIAHRIEILRAADRIFDMLTGRFVSLAGADKLERI
ncbi:ATP-binding cassette domain-containing protein [Asticcacaulis sp.]|uniref:ATP-binding cassette domain-containing protein n=1 Tax=Asticcacaulis sp. TaxID=1872648 RepID=UPI002CAE997B|nr:ATP-binding cassette domain-containing protein [Asticcacaulis sp.]HTM79923.1 ATP-binding cassette domain-containing protein [Asticcacaulis sp.]